MSAPCTRATCCTPSPTSPPTTSRGWTSPRARGDLRRGRAARGVRRPAARGAAGRRSVVEELVRPPSPARAPARPALLRLRDRRHAARGARRRLAGVGLGPERRHLRRSRPRPSVVEEVAGALAARAVRPARRGRRSASSPAARWRTSPCLAAARHGVLAARRLGRRGATASPARRACTSSPARSATSRSTARCASSGSAPPPSSPCPSTTQGAMRADALRRRPATGEGPTIVCAQAGNVNTGALDAFARDRATRRAERRRVAARRRRVRPVGGGEPAPRRLVARRRARRLVGHRRAQVAQRALRLRRRVRRATPRRTARR